MVELLPHHGVVVRTSLCIHFFQTLLYWHAWKDLFHIHIKQFLKWGKYKMTWWHEIWWLYSETHKSLHLLSSLDEPHAYHHGLLMLRNCFLDFAVEKRFGCRTTEPGFAGDIGAKEYWLIDWLIDHHRRRRHHRHHLRRHHHHLLLHQHHHRRRRHHRHQSIISSSSSSSFITSGEFPLVSLYSAVIYSPHIFLISFSSNSIFVFDAIAPLLFTSSSGDLLYLFVHFFSPVLWLEGINFFTVCVPPLILGSSAIHFYFFPESVVLFLIIWLCIFTFSHLFKDICCHPGLFSFLLLTS